MDLKKLENKLDNLKRIEQKVNNDKNILLIDIMKQNRLLSFYVKNARHNKNMILALRNEYSFKSLLVSKDDYPFKSLAIIKKIRNLFIKPKELWIYLTEEQKYATDSYSRYENNILTNTKKVNADFITIGKRAAEFCKLNNLNIIYEIDNSDIYSDLSWRLCQIIKFLFAQENYESLHFVINSNKNINGNFTILPVNEFNIDILSESSYESEDTNIKSFKIFPNIDQYISSQINSFIENSVQSLLFESSFYKSKIGLVSTNKIINELDDEMKKIGKKIIRIKRENEIEEIVLLTSNNKKFLTRGDNN
ncbi:MSC_0622 family F1-like ATPase gamma subunit [Mycoplasmopsis bovis]|uniref:MSC_0622 family F1-like ATPase gamma subunit n=1 Tax=Mycoplasmopsis bovis TaxID=28903 RepID=UPI003D27B98F